MCELLCNTFSEISFLYFHVISMKARQRFNLKPHFFTFTVVIIILLFIDSLEYIQLVCTKLFQSPQVSLQLMFTAPLLPTTARYPRSMKLDQLEQNTF